MGGRRRRRGGAGGAGAGGGGGGGRGVIPGQQHKVGRDHIKGQHRLESSSDFFLCGLKEKGLYSSLALNSLIGIH